MRDGWKQFPLGEIVELGKGGSWGQDDPSVGLIQAVCLRGTDLADLIDGKIPNAPVRWIKESELRKSECSKDMVLIETSGSKCGRSIVLTEEILAKFDLPVIYSNFCRTLTIETKTVTREFIEIWFSHNYANGLIPSYRATSAMPNLDVKALLRVEHIQVPPLPEQKRIVDLISSVDSYIEALQQQLESAKNSKSAYVNTIVSEIFATGKKTKISDIAEVKGGKRLPKGTPWSEEPTDHRYIRATDIKDGIVLTENLVYVPDDVWPLISRYVVNQGDVVITIAGTIGQVGVIPTSLEGVNLTENAAKIVVNKELVRSNYLSMLLGSNYYQQDIDSKTKKTTQPKLGLNMINSIEIPLPDLAEQDEIFSVVSQIDTLITRTNSLIRQTIALRTSFLSDLLSGEHEIPASYDKVMGAA